MTLVKQHTNAGVDYGEVGSSTRARTWDLRINSPSLYRLSYRGIRDLQNQNPTAVLQMRHRMKGPNYTNPGRGVPQLALTRHFGIQQPQVSPLEFVEHSRVCPQRVTAGTLRFKK